MWIGVNKPYGTMVVPITPLMVALQTSIQPLKLKSEN